MRLSFSVLIPVILCLENRKIRMIFCFTRKAFLRNTPVPRTPASITHSLACYKQMSKVLVHPHKKAAAGCTHTLPCLCAWAGAGTDGKAGSFRSEGQNVLQAQQVWEVTPSWQGFDSSSDDIQPVVFSRRQPDETPECDSGARLRKWSQNKKKNQMKWTESRLLLKHLHSSSCLHTTLQSTLPFTLHSRTNDSHFKIRWTFFSSHNPQ